MEWFILLIPIVLSVAALLIFKHALTWFETLTPIAIGVIIIFAMKMIMVNSVTQDTEYFSGYVVEATYYEDWNEYISRTCTRSYPCGKSTCTSIYDCSYVDYNSEYWEVKLNTGKTISVTKEYWESLVKLFGNKAFLDMKRDYHTNDGDAYTSIFLGEYDKLVIYDWIGTYSNRPQTNETIFHFEDLKEEELEGIVNYPEVKNWNMPACIGCTTKENESLRKLNGLRGKDNQIHVFIVQSEGHNIELSERQRRHWKHGNKNELIINIDKDSKWAKSFSWSDDKRLEAECNALFQDADLTLTQKINKLDALINNHWVRKEFEDFNYIEVQIKPSQIWWIVGVVSLSSIIFLIWGVLNDIRSDKPNNMKRRSPYYRKRYNY